MRNNNFTYFTSYVYIAYDLYSDECIDLCHLIWFFGQIKHMMMCVVMVWVIMVDHEDISFGSSSILMAHFMFQYIHPSYLGHTSRASSSGSLPRAPQVLGTCLKFQVHRGTSLAQGCTTGAQLLLKRAPWCTSAIVQRRAPACLSKLGSF